MDTTTARYLPFLVEIRRRLFFLASLFLVASAIGFIYYEKIIKFILTIFHFQGVNIVFTSPFQFINLAIQSSMLLGVIVIFPFIIFQIIAFLKPALRPKEYKNLLILLPLSIVLFITGFVYGVMIMRYTLELFYEKSVAIGVGNFLDVNVFLSDTLTTAMLLGLSFQFPLVLTFFLRTKLIKLHTIAKNRPFVYAFAVIFAVLLPPTDLLSLVLLFLPLAILFEMTLLLYKVLPKS